MKISTFRQDYYTNCNSANQHRDPDKESGNKTPIRNDFPMLKSDEMVNAMSYIWAVDLVRTGHLPCLLEIK